LSVIYCVKIVVKKSKYKLNLKRHQLTGDKLRERLKRHPFVKRSGTKDTAKNATQWNPKIK
jgi:hypothetical protein